MPEEEQILLQELEGGGMSFVFMVTICVNAKTCGARRVIMVENGWR
jgi:hypothetical protein